MTLDEALKHASNAHAWGLDMSYDADEDALSVLYKAYIDLRKEYERLAGQPTP